MAETAPLTLADLVDDPHLGLALVSNAELTARVRGAHTIEIEHPARWLKPGSVMLTTGLLLVGLPPGAAGEGELVDELISAGVVALLFGVGVHVDAVPRGLVAAANARGFPLITVPADVPFHQVEDVVASALQGSKTHTAHRVLWLQNDLLHSLAEPRPVVALTSRLAALVKGTAVIYEESGRQVASMGEGPTRLIWTELRVRPAGRHSFTVGRWHVLARPVVVRGVGYWIALATRRGRTLDDLGDPLLESAQRIFSAVSVVRGLGATQLRAEAAQLVQQLADGVTTEEEGRIWDRLRPFRFTARHPVRLFVAVPDEAAAQAPATPVGADHEDALSLLHDEAALTGLPLLLHVESTLDTGAAGGTGIDGDAATSTLVGLTGGGAALEDWLELLTRTHHVGMSERFTDLVDARRQLRDARRAGQVAVRRSRFGISGDGEVTIGASARGTVVRFEDVDLATWLLSSRGERATEAKVSQQLAPLLRRPDLVETAITWLGSGLDVQVTADRLFMHPNSVRYRLKRIADVLGAPMTSPSIIANLYLAFHEQLAPH